MFRFSAFSILVVGFCVLVNDPAHARHHHEVDFAFEFRTNESTDPMSCHAFGIQNGNWMTAWSGGAGSSSACIGEGL